MRKPVPEEVRRREQRVEAELRALLDGMPDVGPDVPIIRMDADTTSGKGAHERLLEQFAGSDAAVLWERR